MGNYCDKLFFKEEAGEKHSSKNSDGNRKRKGDKNIGWKEGLSPSTMKLSSSPHSVNARYKKSRKYLDKQRIILHSKKKQASEHRLKIARQKSLEIRQFISLSPEVSIIHEEDEPSNVSSRSSLKVYEL